MVEGPDRPVPSIRAQGIRMLRVEVMGGEANDNYPCVEMCGPEHADMNADREDRCKPRYVPKRGGVYMACRGPY